MFDHTSRYAALETTRLTDAEGKEIPYVKRRLLPMGETIPLLTEVKVESDDRLDRIAYKTLGSGEQSWRICDANNAMNPADLTEEPGKILRVPIPAFT